MQKWITFSLLLTLLLLQSCSRPGVTRHDPQNVENEINTDWDTKDKGIFIDRMVADLRNHPVGRQSPPARIRVEYIENQTQEHFRAKALSNKLRNALINLGVFEVLSDYDKLARDAEARDYQSEGSSDGRIRSNEVYADYLMRGEVSQIRKYDGSTRDNSFQFDLELTEIQTGRIVWAKTEEIRKTTR